MIKCQFSIPPSIPLALLGAALTLSLIIFATRILYFRPHNALRFEQFSTVIFPDGNVNTLPPVWYRNAVNRSSFKPGVYVCKYRFVSDREQHSDDYTIVIPYLGATALSLSFNGIPLGSQGDMRKGNSNIWNSVKLFELPAELVGKDNVMEIKLYGLYEAGIITEPYILLRYNNAARLAIMQFLGEGLIWLLSGSILVIGSVVFFTGLISLPRIDAMLFLGFAAILISFFMGDFLTLEYLPVQLVTFRKINVLLRHICSMSFLIGFVLLLEKKITSPLWLFGGTQIACMLVLLFPSDMIALKNVYTITYLTLLPLPFYAFFQLLFHKHRKTGFPVLITGVTVALFCTLNDILSEFFLPATYYVSHYGFITMVMMTSAYIIIDFVHNYRQLLVEKQRADLYREESLHDPMTKAFNRNILPLIQQSLGGFYSVLLVDLDGSKQINDTYGHHTGDMILKDIVALMGGVFRHNDYIVRFGGDEFLVILPRCPETKALRLKEQLKKEIAASRVQITVQSDEHSDADHLYVTYSASIGSATCCTEDELTHKQFQKIISTADSAMYENKRRCKEGKTVI